MLAIYSETTCKVVKSALKYKILHNNNNNCSQDKFVCPSLDCIFCVTYLFDIHVTLHFYF